MQTIIKSDTTIERIWGKQKVNQKKYRLLKYILESDCESGLLLYNIVSGELLFLDDSERNIVDSLPSMYNDRMEELVERHFLVEEEYDEKAIVNHLRKILRTINKNNSIVGYTILPTTYCNARCFYCYETDFEHAHMSEETASRVVKHIVEHCKGQKVQLQWFGGEPTLGHTTITQICKELNDHNVKYESRMISNGYMFDEEMAKCAKQLWNVKKIQITLDGTEEVYNRVKAYVNPCASPFKKVLNNIHLLLQTGIEVQVRINLDEHNEEDVENLVHLLVETFSESSGFQAYVHILFDNEGYEPVVHNNQIKKRLQQKENEINYFLEENGVYRRDRRLPKLRYSFCMADRDQSIVIHPTGDIVKCEHSALDESVGTIYDDSLDTSKISLWKEYTEFDKCNACQLYPDCLLIKKCHLSAECSDVIKEGKILSFKNKMKKKYYEFISCEEDQNK